MTLRVLIIEVEFGDFMLIMSPIFPKPWNCRKLFISLRQANRNGKHGKNAIRHSQEQQANEQQHIRQAVSQARRRKTKPSAFWKAHWQLTENF